MSAARHRIPALYAAIALATVGHAATLQEPTFKTGNRTVAVYATVTSADGRLVPDLARDTFTILDNSKPQALSLFANDIQPITVVMLLDRSGSMRANFTLVEQAAEEFVTDLLPADKARIGSFSNRIQVDPRDFTSSHDELLAILRTELQPEGPTPLWNAVDVGITALLHQQGRRVILVFTDGVDRPMNFRSNNSSLKDVMKRAEEEDVMVYAIGLAGQNGPRGFGGGPGPGGGIGGRGRGGMGRGGFGRGRGGFGGYQQRPQVDEKPDEGLPRIAAATGGGYFELTSTNDLVSTFKRVADELHHQYALGFTPATLDGKMHTLEVRLGPTGMTARARKSYLARAASTS
jgi:Ca-activated chloride channel family protein